MGTSQYDTDYVPCVADKCHSPRICQERGCVAGHDATKAEAFQLLVDRDRLQREVEILHSCADSDKRKIERLEYQLAVWREAFKHTHVAGKGQDIDTCGKCGLDLREEIHLRVGE